MQRVKFKARRIPGNGYFATLRIPGEYPRVTNKGTRAKARHWALVHVKHWTATAPARIVLESCSEKGMTQSDLADEFGVSQATISRWKNDVDPMPVMARRLAANLAL